MNTTHASNASKGVVITGASAGIGKALALEFARRGYNLGLMARRKEALESVRKEIAGAAGGQGTRVEISVLDVNQDESVAEVMNEMFQRMGKVDQVVVNAGINEQVWVGQGQYSVQKRIIQTNLLGAIATLEAAAAYFKAQGAGRIVGISSLAALNGIPTQAGYCASKAGFSAFLDAARVELAQDNIKVTSILPGFIQTDIVANMQRFPFVVSAEKAAREIVDLVEAGKTIATVPAWPWKLIKPFMRLTPDSLWKYLDPTLK